MGTADESPLARAAGDVGPETTEAFELLADETRLAILLALWEAHDPLSDHGVGFSELRERVGVKDSGQFNYHLGKLKGRFVDETEAGYKLRPVGNKVVRAVIGGVGLETPTLEPTEVDMDCPHCGGRTAISYRDGRLFQSCTECEGNFGETDEFPAGMLFSWRLNPAGLADRSEEEIYAAAMLSMLQRRTGMVDGVCPECSGPVDSELEVCPDHHPEANDVCETCDRRHEVAAVYRCGVCKFSTGGPPSAIIAQHPAVVAFYYDHGIHLQYDLDFDRIRIMLGLVERHEQEVLSADPPRVRVRVAYDGDELSLVLDDSMSVVEVDG